MSKEKITAATNPQAVCHNHRNKIWVINWLDWQKRARVELRRAEQVMWEWEQKLSWAQVGCLPAIDSVSQDSTFVSERALTYFILYPYIIFNSTFQTLTLYLFSIMLLKKIPFIYEWSATLFKTTSVERWWKNQSKELIGEFVIQFLKFH